MTYIDYNKYRNAYKRKRNLYLFFLIFSFICLLFSFLLICLKINYLNQKTMKIAGVLIVFLVSFLSFTFLFAFFIPLNNNITHIDNILNGKKSKCIGKVVEIKKEISLAKKGFATEIILNDENGNFIVYFDSQYLDIPFNKNDFVTLILSNSFVVACEVNYEEN